MVRQPRLVAGGKRIAFDGADENTDVQLSGWAIFVANRDGTGLRRLTPRRLNAVSPAWSPDGNWLAFSTWKTPSDLYLIRPDGTDLRRLTRTMRRDDPGEDGREVLVLIGRDVGDVVAAAELRHLADQFEPERFLLGRRGLVAE